MTDKKLIDILNAASSMRGAWATLDDAKKRELLDSFDYSQRQKMIQQFSRLPNLLADAQELAECIATRRVQSAQKLLETIGKDSAREAELNR